MNEQTSEAPDSPAPIDRLQSAVMRDRVRRQINRHYDESPVRWPEIICLLFVIALCDVTVYRGEGFTGYGALVVGLPVLLLLGIPTKKPHQTAWLFSLLAIGAPVRLIWCGSGLAVACGLIVVICFAMSLVGRTPYLVHAAVFASQLFAAGHRGLNHYYASVSRLNPPARIQNVLAIILPAVTLVVFSGVFTFANPDLAATISTHLKAAFDSLRKYLPELVPDAFEVLFCIAAGWIGAGLLRPILSEPGAAHDADRETSSVASGHETEGGESRFESTPLFEAYRNTLIVVTALFAAYLVFEFQTLWFREFPEGFHYSGYAHEGAAWLTVALALATVMLSLMLRGRVLNDPRVSMLQKLSWLWSVENVLLALAVYNRLSIYVAFNGMTRMRSVGLLGMTAVLVGFLLVVRKIAKGHGFRWLVRRQLWTVALAIYLYAVLPVDALVMRHNVERNLDGDRSPSVQIIVHPTTSEGFLQLVPLLECRDSVIREGVSALLVKRQQALQTASVHRESSGWTARQIADEYLMDELDRIQTVLSDYRDRTRREAAIEEFGEYAMQWF